MSVPIDIRYFILVATLFLLPKILLRFKIPAAFTAFFLGVVVSLSLGWFKGEQTLYLLSVFGITSLFLFAGLEVDVNEIKKNLRFYIWFLLIGFIFIFITTWIMQILFQIEVRAAALLTLGFLTPSTGFILDSLKSFELNDQESHWTRALAIASELLALGLLFFVLQSDSVLEFSYSLVAIVGMIFILPFLFKAFLKTVSPFAPNTEFSFLILLALLCGVITRYLGTYYLVGAFIVGLTARQFEKYFPQLQKDTSMNSLRLFFSFFIPFYFFRSGTFLEPEYFSLVGLAWGVFLAIVITPMRYLVVGISMRHFLKDECKNKRLVSTMMLPNLVFGLVIAGLLKEQFQISGMIFTALVVYTIIVSLIPSIIVPKSTIQLIKPS